MGFSLKSVFSGNPLSGLLGGGDSGGSSSMYSGGIGSSTGNTNAQTTTTTTDTKNEDRRLVIAEGGIGINSEGQGVTLNVYGSGDATKGAGYSQAMNQVTPYGGGLINTNFDWATWIQDNKLWLAGGAAVLIVGAAFAFRGGK